MSGLLLTARVISASIECSGLKDENCLCVFHPSGQSELFHQDYELLVSAPCIIKCWGVNWDKSGMLLCRCISQI